MKNWMIWISCIVPFIGFSQSGPGGIGSNDGSSALEMWFAADTAVYTDAGVSKATNLDAIQQWNDLSGNNNHAIQTNSTYQPGYSTSGANGIPVLNFTTDEIRVNYDISPSVQPTITVIAVAEHNNATNAKSKLFGHDNAGFDRSLGFDPRCGAETFQYFGGSGVNCFVSPVANTSFIIAGEFTNTTFTGWYNGANSVPTTANSNGGGESFLTIGGITDRNFGQTYSEFWDGGISEFIVFNSSLNSAEHIIINNYLSAKYDVPLSTCDVFTGDNLGEGDYDHEVAGIGRMDASNIHSYSRGMGMVEMSVADDLDDDEFLMWGHNSASKMGNEKVNVPSGMQARIDRVWRISEKNIAGTAVDVGNVDVAFDLSEMGTITRSDLRLLIDADGDFSSGATTVGGAIDDGGNMYRFSGISGFADGMYFTIATINTGQTPFPIELTEFTVEKEFNHVVLKWTTSSETNNNYFLIERSFNGKDWNKIAQVNGAGTTNLTSNYQFFDQPNTTRGTCYYRLTQIDFDGVSSVEGIRTVQYYGSTELEIYPNPGRGIITLRSENSIKADVSIIDATGREVAPIQLFDGNTFAFDTQNFPRGIYFVRIQTASDLIIKKLILKE